MYFIDIISFEVLRYITYSHFYSSAQAQILAPIFLPFFFYPPPPFSCFLRPTDRNETSQYTNEMFFTKEFPNSIACMVCHSVFCWLSTVQSAYQSFKSFKLNCSSSKRQKPIKFNLTAGAWKNNPNLILCLPSYALPSLLSFIFLN